MLCLHFRRFAIKIHTTNSHKIQTEICNSVIEYLTLQILASCWLVMGICEFSDLVSSLILLILYNLNVLCFVGTKRDSNYSEIAKNGEFMAITFVHQILPKVWLKVRTYIHATSSLLALEKLIFALQIKVPKKLPVVKKFLKLGKIDKNLELGLYNQILSNSLLILV